jgi:hypothetical protein
MLNMMNTKKHKDAKLILSLGGVAEVAKLIGVHQKKGGVQRVFNWLTRGIPAQVKVDFPHLFLNK